MDAMKKNNNAAIPDQQPSPCPSELSAMDIRAAFGNAVVPAAVLILLGYILVGTVREVRDKPRDLAFVAFAYADMAALFLCLRRAERLPRELCSSLDGDEEGDERRRRLQLAVWMLSTALSCAFAYRVSSSLIVPPVLVVVVWSMTSFVAIVGFFALVLWNKDQGCRAALAGDGDAGECKGLAKKIIGNDGDELV